MTLMTDEAHVAYCREARRLRCVHARRPARMLRAISDLSEKYDTQRPASKPPMPEMIAPVAVSISPRPIFAEKVSAELADDLLTYSKRQELIAEADRMGIGRFDANLLIAEAQHRAKSIPTPVLRERRFPIGLFGVALVLEAVVIIALLHAIR